MVPPSSAPQPDPPGSTGKAPVERQVLTPAQLHHHEMRFLKALKLLVESGKARTTQDLIRYAEQDKQTQAAGHLRQLEAEGLPVDLAYDALDVHTRIVAHKRNNGLLEACQGRRVGLVLPLPPHVVDAFTTMTDVTLMLPDGHHLPPNLRQVSAPLCHNSREARHAVEKVDALVFEAFAADGTYHVGAGTADIVDLRIVPQATQLIVHLRPHRNPDDVVLQHHERTLQVL